MIAVWETGLRRFVRRRRSVVNVGGNDALRGKSVMQKRERTAATRCGVGPRTALVRTRPAAQSCVGILTRRGRCQEAGLWAGLRPRGWSPRRWD